MSETSLDLYFLKNILSELCFTNIGKSVCNPNHFFGPVNRTHYIFHFVTDGKGIFRVKNKQYSIQKNQFFLVYPGTSVFYEADQYEPWSYYWMAMDGKDVEKILNILNISLEMPVGLVEKSEDLKQEFEKTILLIQKDTANLVDIYGKLFWLLSHFNQNIYDKTSPFRPSQISYSNPFVAQFIEYIDSNYSNCELSVQTIAQSLAVHRTYLSKIIKRELGVTPSEYLMRYRILKSSILLESTDYKVEEIAIYSGFKSTSTFNKSFRKVKEMSPREYRNKKIPF